MTVTRRFSSDLRLNVHFHTLVADGVWADRDGKVSFEQADPLGELDVQEVLWDAQLRIDRQLKAHGWQDRQDDPFADNDPALAALMRASIRGELFDPPDATPWPSWSATCVGRRWRRTSLASCQTVGSS